jgi:hypothetical protein
VLNFQGYVPLRRAIMEHLYEGKMTFTEFGLFTMLLIWADHRTGIALTNGVGLVGLSGKQLDTRYTQRCLANLEKKGYIKRPFLKEGQRGDQKIFIDKYLVTEGTRRGRQLSFADTTNWENPAYVFGAEEYVDKYADKYVDRYASNKNEEVRMKKEEASEPLASAPAPVHLESAPPAQPPSQAPSCTACAHLALGSCRRCGKKAGESTPTETPGAATPPTKRLGGFDPRELNEAIGKYSAAEVAKIVQWHWVESKDTFWRGKATYREFFERNLDKMAAQVPAVWLKPSQKPNSPTITAAPGVHGNKSGFKW